MAVPDLFVDDEGIVWTREQLAKVVRSFGEAPPRDNAPKGYVWMPIWLVEIMRTVIPPEPDDIIPIPTKGEPS